MQKTRKIFKSSFSFLIVLVLLFGTGQSALASSDLEAKVKQLAQEVEQLKSKQQQQLGKLEGIADKISFHGIIAGAYQYESGISGDDDFGRGALPIQPEVSIKPTEKDEIFFKLGFAAGNGLNGEDKNPFVLAPWAADLEDDVRDINGRNRDYLLTAWYKHMFSFGEGQTLGITGGIIDATDYLDENRYANDEYTQFMNEALVNSPIAFLPSYDIGGALEWEMEKLAIEGVIMGVGENDDRNAYNFYGIQAGYTLETPLGGGPTASSRMQPATSLAILTARMKKH